MCLMDYAMLWLETTESFDTQLNTVLFADLMMKLFFSLAQTLRTILKDVEPG